MPAPRSPVMGTLKGYDQLLNLVLDEAVEFLRGAPPPPCALCCDAPIFSQSAVLELRP